MDSKSYNGLSTIIPNLIYEYQDENIVRHLICQSFPKKAFQCKGKRNIINFEHFE